MGKCRGHERVCTPADVLNQQGLSVGMENQRYICYNSDISHASARGGAPRRAEVLTRAGGSEGTVAWRADVEVMSLYCRNSRTTGSIILMSMCVEYQLRGQGGGLGLLATIIEI